MGLMSKQRARLPHLVEGKRGVAGEVDDLRRDLVNELDALAPIAVEEFIDPAAADVDAIKTSAASAAAVQSFVAADLDGVVGAGEMVPPRNLDITSTLSGDIDAVDVVITGKVRNAVGRLVDQTDTITLTDGGNVTDAGTLPFSTVETITVPAQSGTGGALSFGFGDLIGLAQPLVSRAGLEAVIREVAIGAVVTTGTFVDAAGSAPHGTYSPAAAADAANDYAVYYEYDPT